MATTFMLEMPMAPASAGSGSSSSALQMSHTRSLKIPNFDDADYNTWVLSRLVKAKMANYEANMGVVRSSLWRKVLLTQFQELAKEELSAEEDYRLHWDGVPEKKAKKNVVFTMDVPYKHNPRTDEVFEGPISSQLHFEKEAGEDGPVFVNPERSI